LALIKAKTLGKRQSDESTKASDLETSVQEIAEKSAGVITEGTNEK
jgi:hypothetical protein